MRTDKHQIGTRDTPSATQEDIKPEELWLNQDITGEELINLDPLEEDEDLLALANEGLDTSNAIIKGFPGWPHSDWHWQILMRTFKAELRKKHGGSETFAEFRQRLRGRA